MKLRFATVGAILLGCAGTQAAEPAEVIREAAKECWSLVDLDMAEGFEAMVDARVSDGGYTEVRIRSYLPDDGSGRVMSAALLRALKRCAPYDVPPGLYQFAMTYEDPFEAN